MPNIKSASKRMRQSEKRREANNARRSSIRTLAKKVEELVAAKKTAEAEVTLRDYQQAVDKAVGKGLIKGNNGARRTSRLTKKVASAKKA